MRLEIDEESKTLSLSARELAEDRRFHPIGFDRGEGWGGFAEGSELHSRVLRARQARFPGYRAEVYLQARVPVDDGWTAIVTGRLDGCHDLGNGDIVIEEFKSAFLGSGEFRPAASAHARHSAQLMIYCDLWARLGNPRANGAVVYVDVASGREAVFPYAHDPAAAEKEIKTRLARLLDEWRAGARERERKAVAAQTIPFPHSEPRAGQRLLIEAIDGTIAAAGHILAEAPTGSGKTAASLYPAVRSGLAEQRQVVFLTAKNLQQTMAVKALRKMNADGAFRTIHIRSKERMCANGQVLCHEDFCPFAKNYPDKMNATRILDRIIAERPHFDPDEVFAEARAAEVCPFEVQLELAERADVIVGDYNYVFEPAAALRHLEREGLDRVILLVDEAHNLPDRARNIFSPAIAEEELKAVYQECLSQSGPPFDSIALAVEEWLGILHRLAAELPAGEAIAEIAPRVADLQTPLEDWQGPFLSYLAWKRERKHFAPEDKIVALSFAMIRFAAVLRLLGPGFSCVIDRRGESLRLRILCLDPARAVGRIFRATRSTIFISATLSPREMFEKSLGLEAGRVQMISLPPPFPAENRKILILPHVRTSYKARDKNYRAIAARIAEMASAHAANYLALFPSYAFLEEVAGGLGATTAKVIAQRPNLKPREREQIMEALEAPPPGGILLLAVLGGMYAEGVDYPGELLSGVFVVSPALPKLSFERELLRRHYDERDEPGFDYAYLQPGMTRVAQAAGRLIRSETDRGVIALICARFLEEPYRSWLPRDWYDRTPTELVSENPAEDVRRFFARDGG